VDDPEARTHDGLNAHTRGAPMLVDGSGDLGRGRLKRGMGGLDACALGGTSKAGGSGTRGSFSEGNRRGAETSLYGISPDDDVASFGMGEPSGGATLGSWVTVLGDGSDEICDSVAMTAGNYIRGMGESVPSVGTSDGGGGRRQQPRSRRRRRHRRTGWRLPRRAWWQTIGQAHRRFPMHPLQ
jgi:hypothetical protein